MRLLTISASNTCHQCQGTGVRANFMYDQGKATITLGVCSCVSTRFVKPKPFAAEVAKHLKERK
jgi:hypothetical protein